MDRYFEMRERALKLLEEKAHGFYKRQMLSHMFQVETLSVILAKKRQLNVELSAIIGLLHDLSIPLDCNDFQHARRSSHLAQTLLAESGHFSNEEISIITHAIATHSHKETIDDPYSELIKDADVYAHVLEGQSLKEIEEKRYAKLQPL